MTVGVCPYCGAKLNLGLKFCVLCGRHISPDSKEKLGGLKSGFRAADITWRLNEIVTVGRFKKSRRNIGFERAVRSVFRYSFNFVSTFVICFALLYTVVQLSLELVDPGRAAETRIHFGKMAGFVADSVEEHAPPDVTRKIREAGHHAHKTIERHVSGLTAEDAGKKQEAVQEQGKTDKSAADKSKQKKSSKSRSSGGAKSKSAGESSPARKVRNQ